MADIAKVNPVKALENQIAQAKSVKDVLKVDFAKDRFITNWNALSGRQDGLQKYEQEVLNFIELANSKPDIMNCDKFSIVAGFMRAAGWNLSFQGNDLSVYPRGGKLVVEPQAHGKRRLLEKMSTIKEVAAGTIVFKGENFVYDIRRKVVVKHEIKWPAPEANPSTVDGAYCTITYTDGSQRDILVNASEIAKARAASKMQDGGQLWIQYYGEACKKTAYNRAFKELWRKPETTVFYEQWESKDEDQQPETVDQNVEVMDIPDSTSVGETKPISATEQVNTDTGEVTPTVEPKVEGKKARKNTASGDLGL